MIPKKIYQLRPDIKEKVDKTYPESKKRGMCKIDKANYEGKRWAMAVRLYEEIGVNKMEFK